MPAWQRFRGATVVGDVRVLRDVRSPQLRNARDVYVYLPPSHARGARRYPVLYLQDGQNLFDEETSYAGEWRVDETMEALAREGLEAIVVGIENAGGERIVEYSVAQGRGADYLRFLVETVKPLVDSEFRTERARESTGLGGSSLGGLISLYGLFLRADVFGLAAVMSPALWFAGGAVFETVERAPFADSRIYMDVGAAEHHDAERRRAYVARFERMVALLEAKGYGPDRFRHLVDPRGTHHESAWARRLPDALRFLLGPRPPGPR